MVNGLHLSTLLVLTVLLHYFSFTDSHTQAHTHLHTNGRPAMQLAWLNGGQLGVFHLQIMVQRTDRHCTMLQVTFYLWTDETEVEFFGKNAENYVSYTMDSAYQHENIILMVKHDRGSNKVWVCLWAW